MSNKTTRPESATGLRPLNLPRPAEVLASPGGEPVAITLDRRRHTVTSIQDRWRIDDLWWRQPLTRIYFVALLDDGRTVTLFHDLHEDSWAVQRYG